MSGTQAYVSIGQNCTVASWLKAGGLRCQSMLCDWTRSPLPAVCAVLDHGLAWHMEHVADPSYPIEYPHHQPIATHRGYVERCAMRFFASLAEADELILIHCAPLPIDAAQLQRVEELVQRHRQADFRILALHGFRAPDPEQPGGIVRRVQLTPRIQLCSVSAPKEFDTNRMQGSFYEALRAELLPGADPARLYRSTGEVDDVDPA